MTSRALAINFRDGRARVIPTTDGLSIILHRNVISKHVALIKTFVLQVIFLIIGLSATLYRDLISTIVIFGLTLSLSRFPRIWNYTQWSTDRGLVQKISSHTTFFLILCFVKATSRTSNSVITYLVPQSLCLKFYDIFLPYL